MGMSIATEKDLEDEIWQYIIRRWECPVSSSSIANAWRQPTIKSYGIPDIVYVRNLKFGSQVTVMELKNTELKPDHLNQLARYMTAVKRCLGRQLIDERFNVQVRGLLVGPMKSTDWVWLFQSMDNIHVYATDVSIEDGVTFDEINGWHNTTEDLRCLDPKIRESIQVRRGAKEGVAA